MVNSSSSLYSLGNGTTSSSSFPGNALVMDRSPTSSDIRGPNGAFSIGQLWVNKTLGSSFQLVGFSSSGGFVVANWITTASATGALNTLSGNTGSVIPSAGNIAIEGADLYNVTGSGSTLTISPTISGYPITPFVVGPVGSAGYQTIQSAIDAANANGGGTVYVQPGFYAENLIMHNNIYLVGVTVNGGRNVNIQGVVSATDLTADFGFQALSFNATGSDNCMELVCDTPSFVTCRISGCSFNSSSGSGIVASSTAVTLSLDIVTSELNCGGSTIDLTGASLSIRYSNINNSAVSCFEMNANSFMTAFYCIVNAGNVGANLNDVTANPIFVNCFGSFVQEFMVFNAACQGILVATGFSCSATSGYFASGAAGTLVYGNLAILGSGSGISPGLTQSVATQLAKGAEGTSSAVQGSSSFNTADFIVVDGFVSLR